MSKVILVDGSKTICGYPCKKAEIHFMLDGKPYVSSAWYTPQIKNKAITLSGKLYEELDGLLMEFDVENKGMKMRMLAKSIEFKEIDAALFQVPADYKKVSMEDLYKQFGNIH